MTSVGTTSLKENRSCHNMDEPRVAPDRTGTVLAAVPRTNSMIEREFSRHTWRKELRQRLLAESDVVNTPSEKEKIFGRTDWRVNKNNESCVRAILRDKGSWTCYVRETIDPFAESKANDAGVYMRNLDALRANMWILNSRQTYALRSHLFITRLPQITKTNIDAVSKSDTMSQILTITQLLWLIAQIIARTSANLPITQLESATCAFATSSILTYGYFWSRPKAVKAPTIVELKRKASPDLVACVAGYGLSKRPGDFVGGSSWNAISIKTGVREPSFRGAMANATCFGLIHCTAWNYDFPTPVEKTL